MPFIDQAAPYRLVRTTRGIWLAGQVVYVALAVMVYDLFLLTAEALIAMPWAYTGNVWSETSAAFAYSGEGTGAVPVSLKTMEMSTPYACAWMVFLLMLLYSLFIASLMLFLNLTAGNAAGVIGALLVNLYGYLLNPELLGRSSISRLRWSTGQTCCAGGCHRFGTPHFRCMISDMTTCLRSASAS